MLWSRRYAARHTAFTWCSMLSVESYTIPRFFVVASGYIKQPSTVTWMFVATVNLCLVPKVIIFVLFPFSSSLFSRNQESTSSRQCWSSWSAFLWSHGRNEMYSWTSSAYMWKLITSPNGEMYIVNNSGPSTDPWVTPLDIGRLLDVSFPMRMYWRHYQVDLYLRKVVPAGQPPPTYIFTTHLLWVCKLMTRPLTWSHVKLVCVPSWDQSCPVSWQRATQSVAVGSGTWSTYRHEIKVLLFLGNVPLNRWRLVLVCDQLMLLISFTFRLLKPQTIGILLLHFLFCPFGKSGQRPIINSTRIPLHLRPKLNPSTFWPLEYSASGSHWNRAWSK